MLLSATSTAFSISSTYIRPDWKSCHCVCREIKQACTHVVHIIVYAFSYGCKLSALAIAAGPHYELCINCAPGNSSHLPRDASAFFIYFSLQSFALGTSLSSILPLEVLCLRLVKLHFSINQQASSTSSLLFAREMLGVSRHWETIEDNGRQRELTEACISSLTK